MSAALVPHPSLPSPWVDEIDPDRDQLPAWTDAASPPVVWSVAGTDSGGGAGLSADTRAAAAMGVHLCPVVAAVTAQHSRGVAAVFPLEASQIRAQLSALWDDLPPRVIKTGLLASASAVDALLAQRREALLVVDPVLGATSGGAAFCDEALLSAYRHQLLPHAALVTPNRREAERLLGVPAGRWSVPALARGLRALGAGAVCITGGDDVGLAEDLALDWLDSDQATGWLALPRLTGVSAAGEGGAASAGAASADRLPTPAGAQLHHHGSGCTFATAAAAALARGFAVPDAVVLAKMLTWQGLRDGHAAGAGAGPLRPKPAFIADPAVMPVMGFADEETLTPSSADRWRRVLQRPTARNDSDFLNGLYAITDQPDRVAALAGSGQFAHLQLRMKRSEHTSEDDLRRGIARAIADATGTGTRLWINDHWALALEAGAGALHLGQEDWAALAPDAREQLQRARWMRGMGLGISSHSLWELCRARGLDPTYIACGPLWATVTKDMPWLPQGLAQLRWWVRMAGVPVVGIGGVLTNQRLMSGLATGAASMCLVRAAETWVSEGTLG